MSLGKIHMFGLYLPSQKIKRRATRTRTTSSEHFAVIDALQPSAPISPKGIKRSAQKVLHVKNRKVVASMVLKNQKMSHASNNNASR